MFLQRCALAFQQLMFEQLQTLFLALKCYIDEETTSYTVAPLSFELWVEHEANSIEKDVTKISYKDRLEQISEVTDRMRNNTDGHSKYLLTGLAHTTVHDDTQATADIRRYFDYNMRQKITKGNTETGAIEFVSWAVKVHQPALNLALIRLKHGQLDEALLGVMEAVKLAQNKNDHESITQCLVLL